MMTSRFRRLVGFGALTGALAMVSLDGPAVAQRHGGGGAIVFTTRRPPREYFGNVRGWASSVHTTNYNEDIQAHAWRVNFMAFLPHPPNSAEVTLSWFHIESSGVRTYVSNEPIALTDPRQRILSYTTSLHRAAGQFEPMERYEAVLSVNDSHGARELARGSLQLIGQVERHSGVVDFTGSTPTAH
jgi:hypothetical protein